MSIISTAANYGGKVADNQQGVKQFYVSSTSLGSIATWVFRRINGGTSLVQTPANSTTPVVINNDLVVSGSLYNTSDRRLKEDIVAIGDSEIESLMTLNPIHFRYKHEGQSGRRHFGVIAQEVEGVLPNLIEHSHFGYLTVNYQEMIPLILAKLRDMQEQVDDLREYIRTQEEMD